MIFREHRGGLDESMATCVELKDRAALLFYISKLLSPWAKVTDESLHVSKYNTNGDSRIDWKELYIVSVDGYGVIGWTNEQVT